MVTEGEAEDASGRLAEQLVRFSRLGARAKGMLHVGDFGAEFSALMLLFPLPNEAWQLIVLILVAAPTIGMLWAPSMALLSDGAEAVGIAQGFAFAMSNLGWSIGQTTGNLLSASIADATSDAVPYLLLSATSAVSLAVLARARTRSPTLA